MFRFSDNDSVLSGISNANESILALYYMSTKSHIAVDLDFVFVFGLLKLFIVGFFIVICSFAFVSELTVFEKKCLNKLEVFLPIIFKEL